jgi:hypothetical protein
VVSSLLRTGKGELLVIPAWVDAVTSTSPGPRPAVCYRVVLAGLRGGVAKLGEHRGHQLGRMNPGPSKAA